MGRSLICQLDKNGKNAVEQYLRSSPENRGTQRPSPPKFI